VLESPVELTDEQSALVSSHVRVEFDGGSTSVSTDGTVVRHRSCRVVGPECNLIQFDLL